MDRFILNIIKGGSRPLPQVVGRVADLPQMPLEVEIREGESPIDLTNAIVEFRGTTPDDKKIMMTSGVEIVSAKKGLVKFTFPKNFYTSPGRFKRAYFVIKRGDRLDSTQDLTIHVIESIDFDLEDSKDIIEGLDQVIEEVTDKMNRETQAMIDEIQKEYDNLEALMQKQANDNIAKIDREIKIAIDESKLRMRQLESEYRGVINNAQLTLNQLQAEVDKIKPFVDDATEQMVELENKVSETESNVLIRLDELDKKIDDKDVAKQHDLQVQNNQLTHGVDYIEPPLQGYKKERIWKPEKTPVYIDGMNLVINPQEKTLYQTDIPEIGQYLIKKDAYSLDIVDTREQPLIVVFRARGKGNVIINLSVNQGLGQFKLSDDYSWYYSDNITMSRANYSHIYIYGRGVTELEITDLYIIWNPSKPYEQYFYENNPSINETLSDTGVLITTRDSDVFYTRDFKPYRGGLYEPNMLNLQTQIDELSKIVTALGGS